jgi:hypothetical protein
MNVHVIPLNLHKPDEQLLNIFIFQWHTPEPIAGAEFAKIPSPHLEQKANVLNQFCEWYLKLAQQNTSPQLTFIIAASI